MLVIRAGIHKTLVRIANMMTLIRLRKQSHLGLHRVARLFRQATFITFTLVRECELYIRVCN